MKINLKLLSDLCVSKTHDKNMKNGIIKSEILSDAIYNNAISIMNVYNEDYIEYYNYKDMIYNLFESENRQNFIFIRNGTYINKKKDFLEEYKVDKNTIFKCFKSGCEFDFSIKLINRNKYRDFLNICLLSIRYLGIFNKIGMGEVTLKLIET